MPIDSTRLWQLISPALPVGAFHYSQALEQAVTCGWVHDAETAKIWIAGILKRSVASVDLPIMRRVFAAWCDRDASAVKRWDDLARACRETAELRDEDQQMGRALCDLAWSLEEPLPGDRLGFPAAFAVIAVNNKIPLFDTLQGYAWAWCENQVLAAVKLVPLGHRAGQLLLRDIGSELAEVTAEAMSCPDEKIGVTAPGFVLASARHETQYTRLFRS